MFLDFCQSFVFDEIEKNVLHFRKVPLCFLHQAMYTFEILSVLYSFPQQSKFVVAVDILSVSFFSSKTFKISHTVLRRIETIFEKHPKNKSQHNENLS